MEDKELLRLLQRDAERGLEAALDEYGSLVKTIVSRVLYDFPQDAEECISDVFLRLWKNRKKLGATPVRAWLIITARNAAIDRWRKVHKTEDVPLGDDVYAAPELPEEKIGPLIGEMTQPDKDIFIRKYYLLETSAEIAQATGRTEDDINTRLSRGRKRLKDKILKGGRHFYEQKALQTDCKN